MNAMHTSASSIFVTPIPGILKKCFRFEASWLQEEGCERVVEEAWNQAFEEGAIGVNEGLKKVGGSLATWDREVLGELKLRIKRVKKELENYRRKEINQQNINKEQLLKYKLSRLEDQYNVFWQQRARVNWLQNGDRNTSFFHAHASERKKVNKIKRLRREGGGVVEREEELGPFITNFYKSLFLSSAGQINDDLLQYVPQSVTTAMNDNLSLPYTTEEVRKALDSIGDLKAPGPDGMPAIFYKKFWHILGDKVQAEVLEVLNGGEMPQGWNETEIVLIPKVKNPERITEYKPISLCNVIYKLISKVLANRLKVLLPEIIPPRSRRLCPDV
jgi:hypothetical protein